MRTIAGIMIAGAIGALARYGIDGVISERAPGAFPWGTFAINVSGSFLLGLVLTLFTERTVVDPWVRSALTTGFLGAYTTFSTLSLQTARLIENRAYVLAVLNSAGSLCVGVVAVFAGILLGRAL
jgi:CrcB protein